MIITSLLLEGAAYRMDCLLQKLSVVGTCMMTLLFQLSQTGSSGEQSLHAKGV